MKFSELAKEINIIPVEDFDISLITADSRRAVQRAVFFLLPRADFKYAEQAQEKGALVVHDRTDLSLGFRVKDVLCVFNKSLQYYYKDSFESISIYGVTGTNGKTSFSYMLKNMLEAYGEPTGIFGTIGNFFGDQELLTDLTSPAAEDFYKFNHNNFKLGMKNVVCEVSSHALDQKRLGEKFLTGAAFTSFSQDHLDYHADMDDYLKAKNKITTESLKEDGFVVGHGSVKAFETFKASKKITIGKAQYSFNVIDKSIKGLFIEFKRNELSLKGLIPMLGIFNAENFALALSVLCEHFGEAFFPDERVFQDFKQIPGRMESVPVGDSSMSFIDFSHTPDSLKKSLETLKTYSEDKKLVVVFGCGGDRDRLKRPLMGKIATSLADEVIVTSDNPRNENPEAIISDIVKELDPASYKIIFDRAEAIKSAISLGLKEPSIILIAGKGHEDYQDSRGVKTKFSDKDQVYKCLASE